MKFRLAFLHTVNYEVFQKKNWIMNFIEIKFCHFRLPIWFLSFLTLKNIIPREAHSASLYLSCTNNDFFKILNLKFIFWGSHYYNKKGNKNSHFFRKVLPFNIAKDFNTIIKFLKYRFSNIRMLILYDMPQNCMENRMAKIKMLNGCFCHGWGFNEKKKYLEKIEITKNFTVLLYLKILRFFFCSINILNV